MNYALFLQQKYIKAFHVHQKNVRLQASHIIKWFPIQLYTALAYVVTHSSFLFGRWFNEIMQSHSNKNGDRIKQTACLQITLTFQLFVEFSLVLPQLNTNEPASWRRNKWRNESDLRRSPGHLHLPLKTESTVSIMKMDKYCEPCVEGMGTSYCPLLSDRFKENVLSKIIGLNDVKTAPLLCG